MAAAFPGIAAEGRSREGTMEIRQAGRGDTDKLTALDEIASRDTERLIHMRRAVDAGLCLVAIEGEEAVGYAVLTNEFFGHGLIEVLYVSHNHRRRGVGAALMTAMEDRCRTQKLFASTNHSNAAMQALLVSLGYRPSGVIENLDVGDPELVYLKQLGQRVV